MVERIPLEGHPEAFQLSLEDRRCFVNVPDAHEVTVLDLAQRQGARELEGRGSRCEFPDDARSG